MRAACTHKTQLDFTLPGRRYPPVWVCSGCGKQGPWSERWSYWGSIECPKCQTAAMDWVACSPPCAEPLRDAWWRQKAAEVQRERAAAQEPAP